MLRHTGKIIGRDGQPISGRIDQNGELAHVPLDEWLDEVARAVSEAVRYPKMRAEVLGAVQALADPIYQRRVWLEHQYPQPGYYHDFGMAMHTLMATGGLRGPPEGTVGVVLASQLEAREMVKLHQALEALFEQYSTERDDAHYVSAPEWAAVVRAARSALSQCLGSEGLSGPTVGGVGERAATGLD